MKIEKIWLIKEISYLLIIIMITITITLLIKRVDNLEKDLTNAKILNEQYKEDIQRTYEHLKGGE